MFLTAGVFLYNLLCALVPCDMPKNPPEVLHEPRSLSMTVQNFQLRTKSPTVTIPNGELEGYFMTAMNGRLFMAFEGIPYGEAERWKVATPARSWRGVRQTKKVGPDCLQINPVQILRVVGSENCLFVNVYTPQVPDPLNAFKKYPVIVFIHGGAFIFGTGADYGPTYLLSEEVILVTLNYRLGVLGFISAEGVPGNLGLKDQALALKWVHENIEYFGGNKHNVSLWGQSAGAGSVALHLISEKTRDYFSTVVLISGSAFNVWAVQEQEKVRSLTRRLAGYFNCDKKSSWDMMRCLRRVNVDLLVVSQFHLQDWFPFPVAGFTPIVEPNNTDSFLTMSPAEAYRTGVVAKKPVVAGMTRDEGKGIMLFMVPIPRMFSLRAMWNQIAPTFLQLKGEVNDTDQVVRKVGEFYFKGQNVMQVHDDVFGEILSDRYMNSGIVQGVQAHTSSGSPTYMYLFSFIEGKHNIGNYVGYQSREWGAGHNEDLTYLFNMSKYSDAHKQSDPDHELSSIMVNLLVNFAATGKPAHRNEKGGSLEIWDTVGRDPSHIKLLQLDREIKMMPLPERFAERLKFWNEWKVPTMKLWSPLN